MTDFHADVPHEREKLFQLRLPCVGLAFGKKDHHVDVGAQVELAAAIAADCEQREFGKFASKMALPGTAQQYIHQTRAVANERLDGFVIGEALLKQRIA